MALPAGKKTPGQEAQQTISTGYTVNQLGGKMRKPQVNETWCDMTTSAKITVTAVQDGSVEYITDNEFGPYAASEEDFPLLFRPADGDPALAQVRKLNDTRLKQALGNVGVYVDCGGCMANFLTDMHGPHTCGAYCEE